MHASGLSIIILNNVRLISWNVRQKWREW